MYDIHIKHPEKLLPVLKSAECYEQSYYFRKIKNTLDALDIIDKLVAELAEIGFTTALNCFQPNHHSYHDISCYIEEFDNSEILAEQLCKPSHEMSVNKLKIRRRKNENGAIQIQSYCMEKLAGQSFTIDDKALQKGCLRLDKFYNEDVLDLLCTTIANNFCPCMIVVDDIDSCSIYYSKEKDKKIIATYLKSEGIKLPDTFFIKV